MRLPLRRRLSSDQWLALGLSIGLAPVVVLLLVSIVNIIRDDPKAILAVLGVLAWGGSVISCLLMASRRRGEEIREGLSNLFGNFEA